MHLMASPVEVTNWSTLWPERTFNALLAVGWMREDTFYFTKYIFINSNFRTDSKDCDNAFFVMLFECHFIVYV